VNIANFELEVLEADRVIMNMAIVVGKQRQRTSVFSGKMTYIELNPYWNIPQSIAVKEILPKVKKDPAYLAQKRIKVIEYWRRQEREVNPDKVNWSRLNQDNLKYSFRQDFGPGNALGRVKFMFPNKFDIYLHDTPERICLKEPSEPSAMAAFALQNHRSCRVSAEGWSEVDRRKILAEIGKGSGRF